MTMYRMQSHNYLQKTRLTDDYVPTQPRIQIGWVGVCVVGGVGEGFTPI